MPAGAGRKSEATLAYQSSRRGQFEAIVTEDEWASAIRAQLREAKRGNTKAFLALCPWIVGAEPKHVVVEVDVEARILALAAAIGLEPADALAEFDRIRQLADGGA